MIDRLEFFKEHRSEQYLKHNKVDNFYGDNDLAKSVIRSKYLHNQDEDNLAFFWFRLASTIWRKQFDIYNSEKYTLLELYETLENWKYVFGGRINYALGVEGISSSYSNCYYVGIEHDSLYGIYHALGRHGLTYGKGGGVGHNITILRPRDCKVGGSGSVSPGSFVFMDLYSANTGTIAQHGRRGANLQAISCWHPDVIDFLNEKNDNFYNYVQQIKSFDKTLAKKLNDEFSDRRKVSFSNISIEYDDEFMRAVEAEKDVQLFFPDIDSCEGETDSEKIEGYKGKLLKYYMFFDNMSYKEATVRIENELKEKPVTIYDTRWDGDLQKWKNEGYPIKVYKTVNAKTDVWNLHMRSAWKSAEPGVLYKDRFVENWTMKDPFRGTNPCITGDTLIPVADVRKHVTMKELAEIGDDVPVYALQDNKVTVKTMRNPRITGYDEDIYEVEIEGGHKIKVTGNHKFLVNGKGYIETTELHAGDSLHIAINKFASFEDIFVKSNSHSQKYSWWKNSLTSSFKGEHRINYEGFVGPIEKDHVIHHVDYNGLNNDISNLKSMHVVEHNHFHKRDKFGKNNPVHKIKKDPVKWAQYIARQSIANGKENNPKYSGISNEQLLEFGAILVLSLGRKFSYNEWIDYAEENGLPRSFSNFRKDYFGSLKNFTKMSCEKAKIPYLEEDPRIQKTFDKLEKMGYEVRLYDGQTQVKRTCEWCGEDFWIHHDRREVSFCGVSCSAKYTSSLPHIQQQKIEREHGKALKIKEKHLQVYKELLKTMDSIPMRTDWEFSCKEQGLPIRLGTTYGYQNFKEIKQEASLAPMNHKVVSVTYVGKDTVYNGTVDDVHNFYVGGFEETDDKGNTQFIHLNNLQCGEVGMPDGAACLIAHIVLWKYWKGNELDWESIEKDTYKHVFMQDIILDLNLDKHALGSQSKIARKYRQIGIGITGFSDLLIYSNIAYDSVEAIEWAEEIAKRLEIIKWKASIMLAKEIGSFPEFDLDVMEKSLFFQKMPDDIKQDVREYGIRNSTLSTVAPVGTGSIITESEGSGIEPLFSTYFERRVKQDNGSYKKHKIYSRLINKVCGTDFKKLPSYVVTSHDVHYKRRILMQAAWQKWTGNSISSTINLPEDVSIETINDIYLLAWKYELKGITVYREGSRAGILLSSNKESGDLVPGHADKSPERLPAVRIKRRAEGKKYYFIITFHDGDPYEVFVKTNAHATSFNTETAVLALIDLVTVHGVAGSVISDQLIKHAQGKQSNTERVCRFVSLALRHKIPLSLVVKTLLNLELGVTSVIYHIAKVLSEWIPDGTSYGEDEDSGWVFEGGCVVNKFTGESKC